MLTADARTDSTGYTVRGANSLSRTGMVPLDIYARGRDRTNTVEDALQDRKSLSIYELLSSEYLPKCASQVGGRLLADGHNAAERVIVQIYQKYTIDRETHERRETRGRRSVVYCDNVRYQSIGGYIFVGEPDPDGRILSTKYRGLRDQAKD